VHHVDVASGVVTQVTMTDTNETAPAWSHDGTRVVFGALDARGQWHVWSVDAVTGGDRRIEIDTAIAAQPSADGRAWYFTRPDRPGLWRTSPDAAPEQVIAEVGAGNTLGWLVTGDGVYYVHENGNDVSLRKRAFAGGDGPVATLSQFTWPGFSVSADGVVYYARWDRRESNLMAVESDHLHINTSWRLR
jgi:hypothetical protein